MSDKMRVPNFKLEKVYSDGRREEPQLHALSGIDVNCRMGRRGFLLTSALGAGALAALSSGCMSANSKFSSENATSLRQQIKITSNVLEADYPHGIASHKGGVYALAFSPDSKLLASASSEGVLKTWSMPDGKLRHTLKLGQCPRALAFTPDGKMLFGNEFSNSIFFWEAPFNSKGKDIAPLDGTFAKTALSPDGRMLAVNIHRQKLQLLSVPDGKVLGEFGESALYLDFSPDGTMLVTSGGPDITIYAVPSGKRLKQWEEFSNSQAISADGKLLALRYGIAFGLWSIPSGQFIRMEVVSHQHGQGILAFSPNGKWLAVDIDTFHQKGVLLYRAPFSEQAFLLVGKNEGRAVAFSKDGRFLAVGSSDCIFIWELPKGQEAPRFVSVLFDPVETPKDVSVRQATIKGSTFVGSCGSPLPAGAICTCNCVPGSYVRPQSSPSSGGGGYYCTCNQICTCVPIK